MSASLCSYSAPAAGSPRRDAGLGPLFWSSRAAFGRYADRQCARADLGNVPAGDHRATRCSFPDGAMPSDGLVAAETSLLLFIPRDEFLTALSSVPQAALSLIRDLERRLNRVKLLASGLATSDVESRLYRLLYNLARDEGQSAEEGTVIRALRRSRIWPAGSAPAGKPFPESWPIWLGSRSSRWRGAS
jgi:hypothetical protein